MAPTDKTAALDPNNPGQGWYFTTTDFQPDGEFSLDPSTAGGPYVPEGAEVVQDTDFKPPAATCENQADSQECIDNYYVNHGSLSSRFPVESLTSLRSLALTTPRLLTLLLTRTYRRL